LLKKKGKINRRNKLIDSYYYKIKKETKRDIKVISNLIGKDLESS